MIRRPPRSTQSRSSAASDVYKRQVHCRGAAVGVLQQPAQRQAETPGEIDGLSLIHISEPNETRHDLVCRLLLEKKKTKAPKSETKRLSTITHAVFCLKKKK